MQVDSYERVEFHVSERQEARRRLVLAVGVVLIVFGAAALTWGIILALT
ncbi:hypothetical protein [Crystallibacter crystallopoietes]|nr:hypothetical protein [Arthrobacter crystallopoietes]